MFVILTADGIQYKAQTLPLLSTYANVISMFEEKEIFKYNDREVRATSMHKVIVNESYPTVDLPLGNENNIHMQWSKRNLERPMVIRVIHNKNISNKEKIMFTYKDLFQQCQNGELTLSIYGAAPQAKRDIKTLTINKNTKIEDVLSLLVDCNGEYQVMFNAITFRDSMIDGTRCSIHIVFDDENNLDRVSIRPHYPSNLDIFGQTTENAKYCKNRLLEEFPVKPEINVPNDNAFALFYNLEKTYVSCNLSLTIRDNYPNWTGIQIDFQ